jgi:hypothetical protein
MFLGMGKHAREDLPHAGERPAQGAYPRAVCEHPARRSGEHPRHDGTCWPNIASLKFRFPQASDSVNLQHNAKQFLDTNH